MQGGRGVVFKQVPKKRERSQIHPETVFYSSLVGNSGRVTI